MDMFKHRQIAILLTILSLTVLVHQYIFYGVWFEVTDIHHETFAVALGFGAVVLYYFRRAKNAY